MKRFSAVCVMTLFFVAGGANSTFAQRKMPTGATIARAAKGAKLNPQASTTSEKNGKKVTVTPMDLSKINGLKDLENGQVVAVIDVKGIPDLPDGNYNVFAAKSNGGWRAFFESGGKIAKQDQIVKVSSKKLGERKPRSDPDVMAPNVPGIICFLVHSQNGFYYWVCIELPSWVNITG